MTTVGGFALLFSLVAVLWFGRGDPRRVLYFGAIAVVHVGVAFFFYDMTLMTAADSYWYYNTSNTVDENIFVSTDLIIIVTQFIRNVLDASYLDVFLIFQNFGLIGIFLIAQAMLKILNPRILSHALLLLFIAFSPGIHFWSVAIGKDGLMMLANGLIISAMIRPTMNQKMAIAGIILACFIRPHVGVVYGIAFMGTVLIGNRSMSVFTRSAIVAAGALAVTFFVVFIFAWLGIGDGDARTDFVERNMTGNATGGSALFGDYGAAARIMFFYFAPFLFQASDAMSLVLALDNTALIGVFGFILFNLRLLLREGMRVPFILHASAAIVGVTILLGPLTTNLGLAARQKMAGVPLAMALVGVGLALRERDRRIVLAQGSAATPAVEATASPTAPRRTPRAQPHAAALDH